VDNLLFFVDHMRFVREIADIALVETAIGRSTVDR